MFDLVLLAANASEPTDRLVVVISSCELIRVHQHSRTRINVPVSIHIGWAGIAGTVRGGIELNYLLGNVDLLVLASIYINLAR